MENKVKSYSDLEAVQRDIKRLEKETHKSFSSYKHIRRKFNLLGTEVKKKDQHLLDKTKFKKIFNYMDDLQNKHKVVSNLISSLQNDFGTEQVSRLENRANSLKNYIEKEFYSVFKQTSQISHSIAPENFKKLVGRCYKHASSRLENKYEDSKCEIQFFPQSSSVCYVGYIGFKNVVDKNNFVHNSFYLVVTQYYEKDKRARTYLGQASSKKTPDKIKNDEIVASHAQEQVDKRLQDNLLV